MARNDDDSAFRFGDDFQREQREFDQYEQRPTAQRGPRGGRGGSMGRSQQGRFGGGSRDEFGPEIDRQDRYKGGWDDGDRSYGRAAYGAQGGRQDFASQTGGYQGRDRGYGRRGASARDFDDGFHVGDEGMHSGGFGNQTGFYNDRDRQDRYNASDRGWLERAGDEVASWFGDDEAAARRDLDHRGRGPKGYQRSDDKIREDVSERMFHDPRLDASGIELSVADGEVTLDGTVDSKRAKRRAEDLVDSVAGIGHVQNNLRVDDSMNASFANDQRYGYTAGATDPSATRRDAHKDIASAEGAQRTDEITS